MWETIKNILHKTGGTCIIVEEGKPSYIVSRFDEYQRLLKGIPGNLLYPEADARESLYKFIAQYRLNSVDWLRHFAWLVFIDFFGLNCPSGDIDLHIDLQAARIVQDRLQKWKPDSPEFTRFIGFLVRTRQQKALMDAEPSGIL